MHSLFFAKRSQMVVKSGLSFGMTGPFIAAAIQGKLEFKNNLSFFSRLQPFISFSRLEADMRSGCHSLHNKHFIGIFLV